MDFVKAEVVILKDFQDQGEDLVSNMFEEYGISGVEISDPQLEPDEGWGNDALPKPLEHTVSAYITDDEHVQNVKQNLEDGINEIMLHTAVELALRYSIIKKEDWAETWKEFFKPEHITDSLVVKPTWYDYIPKKDEKIIEIDPGMAFGTGTHPTTSQCIILLEKYLKPGNSVLDIGTGSGILMVASYLFGADYLTGTDNDYQAIQVAEKNLELNQIDKDRYHLMESSLLDGVTETYDIIVANILAEVVDILLDDVSRIMRDSSVLICSGIIEDKQDMITQKIAKSGLEVVDLRIKDSWVAVAARKMK